MVLNCTQKSWYYKRNEAKLSITNRRVYERQRPAAAQYYKKSTHAARTRKPEQQTEFEIAGSTIT